MSATKYRLYTLENDNKVSRVAVPEISVAAFDSILANPPEGETLESLLNKFNAVLVG